jgi:hypothetical protein
MEKARYSSCRKHMDKLHCSSYSLRGREVILKCCINPGMCSLFIVLVRDRERCWGRVSSKIGDVLAASRAEGIEFLLLIVHGTRLTVVVEEWLRQHCFGVD